ncbi:MAG: GLPGLI family protein, partial [Bacteroidetes bacterium]
RTIGPYRCQMATAHFRGRDWTAWFTRAIPVPLGPWKLIGLPGLVIEAHDASGEVAFAAKSVRYGQELDVHPAPPPPDSGRRLTFEEARTFEIETIRRIQRLEAAMFNSDAVDLPTPEWAINWNVMERYEEQ